MKIARFASAFLLLSALFSTSTLAEDAVIFHVIRSPGISWSSPRSLARSTIDLRKRAFSIGHVTVEVRCGDRSFKAGMIQRYGNETTRVVQKEGQALGVLYHLFKGKLQNDSQVDSGLKRMLRSGRLGVIKFLVSRESCERMVEFHTTFQEKKMEARYGFLSRPLQGEGAGCSAFALAFPAVGGFLEPWMVREFGRYHRVPRNWVGGPLTHYRIGVLKLYRKAPRRWARETERGFPLFLYDPDKMYRWIKSRHEEFASETIRPIPVTSELLGIPVDGEPPVLALEIDRRFVLPPQVRNFSTERADPSTPLRDPSLLETWWEDEIRILRES